MERKPFYAQGPMSQARRQHLTVKAALAKAREVAAHCSNCTWHLHCFRSAMPWDFSWEKPLRKLSG